MDVHGKWEGTIVYGKGYRGMKGEELYFEAEIVQVNEDFTGTATDTGGNGVHPDPAVIKGKVSGYRIDFLKQYPTSHVCGMNGETVIDKTKKGHEIHYSGEFNPETKKFTGTWFIRQVAKLFGFIPIAFEGGGTWTMERK